MYSTVINLQIPDNSISLLYCGHRQQHLVMLFSELVKFCEDIRSSTPKQRKDLLKNFVDCCRRGSCVFPVFRLLLPQLDRSRGVYGLKEAKLADLYIKTFFIAANSDDAKTLKEFKYNIFFASISMLLNQCPGQIFQFFYNHYSTTGHQSPTRHPTRILLMWCTIP